VASTSTFDHPILEHFRDAGARRSARRLLIQVGTLRWGEPLCWHLAAIEATDAPEPLAHMIGRLTSATGWDTLVRGA
jgi:hypothetical protein